MSPQDKKKLITILFLVCIVLPAVYFLQEDANVEQQSATQTQDLSLKGNVVKANDQVEKSPDEEPPTFVNIKNSTDRLALQIIAASPNQNESLINEAAKQSSRLSNTLLQNKTIQSQIADAELAIKKSELSKLQIEQEIAKLEAEATGVSDVALFPPPVASVPQGRVDIPPAILDEQPAIQIPQEKELIFDEFNLKGITTVNDSYTAVGSYRGKSLVLRVGSVVNGVYKVTRITENSLVLEKQGKQFEFHVNV